MRKCHVRVIRFYTVLWPAEGGHGEAYRVDEEQCDENEEMSSTASSTVPTRALQRRFVPLTFMISLGDMYLDCTLLEFIVGNKICYE